MEEREKFEFKSEALRKAREKKGYKQDELAKQVFTTRQSISNWENGKKVPTLANVDRLAQILDVSIDDLIVRKVEERLNTNDKEVVNYDANNTYLVYQPNVKKNKKHLKNWKFIKIILALILIALIIYFVSSIRKFVILTDITNKMIKYENINNYSYFKTYFKIENMQYNEYYTKKVTYKDGIIKIEYYDGRNIEIIYIDDNNSILIHENDKEYESLKSSYIENIQESILIDNMFSKIVNNKKYRNIINSLNPTFLIKNNNNQYIVGKYTNKLHIVEKIGVDGLLKEQTIYYSNEEYEKITYEVKFDSVIDDELKVDLDNYELKK